MTRTMRYRYSAERIRRSWLMSGGLLPYQLTPAQRVLLIARQRKLKAAREKRQETA
jgi:hypothetical protein